MPNFKRHINNWTERTGPIATLTADGKNPVLLLGPELIEKGFDLNRSYIFLWDDKTMELGLAPPADGEKGFVVKSQTVSRTEHMLRAKSFCIQFGIKDRMTASAVTQTEDTWVLTMQKMKK